MLYDNYYIFWSMRRVLLGISLACSSNYKSTNIFLLPVYLRQVLILYRLHSIAISSNDNTYRIMYPPLIKIYILSNLIFYIISISRNMHIMQHPWNKLQLF